MRELPATSGSTEAARVPGGPYETEMMRALETSARNCADVYSAPADANTIGDGRWTIDGATFRQTIGGNKQFGAAARATAAQKLLSKIRRELQLGQPDGTDLLGAAQRVEVAIESLPNRGSRPLKVILFTDGANNLGGSSMYNTPLGTDALRRAFVQKLAHEGELPDFHNRVAFYLSGVGLGLERDMGRDIIAVWRLLVPRMHAKLESIDSTLRFE